MKKKTIAGIVIGTVLAGVAVGYYLVIKKCSEEWEKYCAEEDEYEDLDQYVSPSTEEVYAQKCKEVCGRSTRETINVTELMSGN